MSELNWTEIITQSYWPLLVMLLLVLYRNPIKYILQNRKITLKSPTGEVFTISSTEVEQTLNELFKEFYANYEHLLKTEEKALFSNVLASKSLMRIKAVIPSFERANETQLGNLRALRGLGLIEPSEGRRWEAESRIKITKFGELLTTYIDMK